MSFERQPKHYIIALETPPSERWQPIILDHQEQIQCVYDKLNANMTGLLASLISGVINLSGHFGYIKHVDELRSISHLTNISLGKLVGLQIMYELSAMCTSVILKNNDQYLHYRTMDWDLPELKSLTITVDFTRQGQVVYRSLTWAGYIGCFTALKPDCCSVSLNFRQSQGTLSDNIRRLVQSYYPAGYLIRDLMESDLNCQQIIDQLSTIQLVAPCYFIVCGRTQDECVDIVRERDSYQQFMMTDNYLIQTNVDPDSVQNQNRNILWSYERRDLCQQLLSKANHQLTSVSDILTLFNQPPIINLETIYVCLMNPQEGGFKSYIIGDSVKN